MYIKGTARSDAKTKNLVKRLEPGEIAVINHEALDEVAANSLIEKKVKAVINASTSLSERYPNPGPLKLVQAGIPLVDNAGGEIMDEIRDGDHVEIYNGNIKVNNKVITCGLPLSEEYIQTKMEKSGEHMQNLFSDFVNNTLEYARNEIGLINGEHPVPLLKTNFKNKHALIVVRGQNYKSDLMAIKPYVEEMKPVLIGVDGGADALMENGFVPDVIVGDMDSVSDVTLRCGAEVVVHAYTDGRAPGLDRTRNMGVDAVTYPAPGTSEDIAMLMAYERGAELIVAVGTHSNMMDFLEKGRKGMASTFLVRMKVGSKLIDARGVNQLYKNRLKFRHVAQICLAALLPVSVIMVISPSMREIMRLIFIQLKLLVGI